MQRSKPLGVDVFGGAAHRQVLERLAHHDCFGKRSDRDPRYESPGLRKDFH
jgi:hypothetical protein